MPARADDGDSIATGSAPLFWAQVIGNAGLLVAVVPIARELGPTGIGDAELIVLAGAMFASGLADAGYMFVLGCSRFRLHALVTATAAWLYAGTIGRVAATAGLTVLRAALIW